MSDTSTQIAVADAATGGKLDPASVVAAGTTAASHEEAIGQAQATAQYGTMTKQVDLLKQMGVSEQRQVWNSVGQNTQAQLQALGYNPPPSHQQMQDSAVHSGVLGSIFHGLGEAWHAATAGTGKVVSKAMSIANYPLSVVQHGIRTGIMADYDLAMEGKQNDVGALFSPSLWARSWRQTQDGNKAFEPQIERQVQHQYGDQTYNLAKQMAEGIPTADILKGFAKGKQQDIIHQMATDPELKRAVTTLQNAKLSLGRFVVGANFMTNNPVAGKLISGGIDAATDVLADPLQVGGKAAELYHAGQWGVTGERVAEAASHNMTATEALMRNDSKTARWVTDVGNTIQHQGFGALVQRYPFLGPAVDEIAQSGVTDADSFGKWVASKKGQSAILAGRAARTSHGTIIMPHLSPFGLARVAAKDKLSGTINWLADATKKLPSEPLYQSDYEGLTGPHGLAADAHQVIAGDLADAAPVDGNTVAEQKLGGIAKVVIAGPSAVARTVRRMTTLTADKGYLDLAHPADLSPEAAGKLSGIVNLRRMLSYSLPARDVNQLVDVYAKTDDLGKRFDIAKGAVAQMLHLAGAYSTPDGRGAMAADTILEQMDKTFRGETYAPAGIDGMDQLAQGDKQVAGKAALIDGQENTRIFLPSYREVRAAAKRSKFYFGLGMPDGHLMDRFMNAWKAGVLLRPGFALRVSLDEILSDMLRNGLPSTVASRLALRAGKKAFDTGEDENPSWLHRAYALATDHLPEPIVSAIRTPAQAAGAILGDAAWRALRLADPTVDRQTYMEAAEHFHKHVWDALTPQLAAIAHAGGGYDESDNIVNILVDGHKPVPMRWKKNGSYSETTANDELFRHKWQYSLDQYARSKLVQSVLKDIDKTTRTQVKNVRTIIESDEFADTRRMFARAHRLPDGREVGVDATPGQAAQDWARKVVAAVNTMVRTDDGKGTGDVIRPVVDEMIARGRAPDIETLEQIPANQLPKGAFGPELVPLTNNINRLTQKGFNSLSKIIDSVARKPHTLNAFAKAYRDLLPGMREIAGEGENAEELAAHVAAGRAMEAVKPFIHNPEIRSQFEVAHRTAMPFLFAQDQFAKRWVKTFVDSPSAIRRAQLGLNGLRTSGFVQKDQNGNDFFYYPGSQYVTNMLSHVLGAIGIHATIPLEVPFTGALNQIMPGINNPLAPSVGPVVAIPVKALADRFPEFQGTEQTLLQQGASGGYWQQILPTTLSRLVTAFSGNPNTSGEFSSAMMKAIQELEASGHGLPENATTAQKQQFLDRVTNWTRIMFFTKAALGFMAPASPSEQFDPKDFSGRLSTLLNELPYDQAISEFLKENPDATPYTVFMSHTTGGEQLPATAAAGAFVRQNKAFVDAYPQAAGWFMPRTTGNGTYDASVYRAQMQEGLRSFKNPMDFLNDIIMAPAAQEYYQVIDAEQAALNKVGTGAQASKIKAMVDRWKVGFLSANPTYADYLTSGAKATQRGQTIRQVEDALSDPNAPDTPQTGHMRDVLDAYEAFEQNYVSLEGQGSYTAKKSASQMEAMFINWGAQYTKDNPDVQDFWNVLIRPEVGYYGETAGILNGVGNGQ